MGEMGRSLIITRKQNRCCAARRCCPGIDSFFTNVSDMKWQNIIYQFQAWDPLKKIQENNSIRSCSVFHQMIIYFWANIFTGVKPAQMLPGLPRLFNGVKNTNKQQSSIGFMKFYRGLVTPMPMGSFTPAYLTRFWVASSMFSIVWLLVIVDQH